MKQQTLAYICGIFVLVSCSAMNEPGNAQKMVGAPLPPNVTKNIVPNSKKIPAMPQVASESAAKSGVLTDNASAPVYRRRQIIEDRGDGGTVNQITVNNAGDVPDYYLYPTDNTQYNTNDNPERLSVPNWKISW